MCGSTVWPSIACSYVSLECVCEWERQREFAHTQSLILCGSALSISAITYRLLYFSQTLVLVWNLWQSDSWNLGPAAPSCLLHHFITRWCTCSVGRWWCLHFKTHRTHKVTGHEILPEHRPVRMTASTHRLSHSARRSSFLPIVFTLTDSRVTCLPKN